MDGVRYDSPYTATLCVKAPPMRPVIRYAIAILIVAIIPVAALTHLPTAAAQTEPDYRSRTIYFLLADRFNPQHPYNPYVDPMYPDATNSVDCFTQGCTEEEEFRKYWGGDIQGIIEKLGYLQRLGASAIWVTPLAENVRMYEGGTGYGTGYHGYWVQNYYQVNAHFGSWSDVEQFSTELHSHGMRYIQDITLNDSNPLDNHVFGLVYNGNGSVFVASYEDDFDPMYGTRLYKHYQDTPLCEHAPADGNLWNDWQLHHCLLADLSGWNQHDPQVAQYLVGAGETWIDHGIDDLRLDAINYVFPDFVSTFTNAMIDHLEALQRPDPYIVGEWSNGGVGQQNSLMFANDYDVFKTRILDFQLSFALNRFIGGGYEYPAQRMTGNELGEFLSRRVQAFHGDDDWMGTFLDNHDEIRTMTRLDKIGVSNETERRERMDLATVMLMTVRGIPIIYYGDEQYLAVYDAPVGYEKKYINSGNDDPWNRPGMQSWDETTPAFRIMSILAGLRANDSAIWRGWSNTVLSDNDVLIYQRRDGNTHVLVAVNRGAAKDITLHNDLGFAPGTYRGVIADASPANTNNYLHIERRSAVIHVEAISSIVLPN